MAIQLQRDFVLAQVQQALEALAYARVALERARDEDDEDRGAAGAPDAEAPAPAPAPAAEAPLPPRVWTLNATRDLAGYEDAAALLNGLADDPAARELVLGYWPALERLYQHASNKVMEVLEGPDDVPATTAVLMVRAVRAARAGNAEALDAVLQTEPTDPTALPRGRILWDFCRAMGSRLRVAAPRDGRDAIAVVHRARDDTARDDEPHATAIETFLVANQRLDALKERVRLGTGARRPEDDEALGAAVARAWAEDVYAFDGAESWAWMSKPMVRGLIETLPRAVPYHDQAEAARVFRAACRACPALAALGSRALAEGHALAEGAFYEELVRLCIVERPADGTPQRIAEMLRGRMYEALAAERLTWADLRRAGVTFLDPRVLPSHVIWEAARRCADLWEDLANSDLHRMLEDAGVVAGITEAMLRDVSASDALSDETRVRAARGLAYAGRLADAALVLGSVDPRASASAEFVDAMLHPAVRAWMLRHGFRRVECLA